MNIRLILARSPGSKQSVEARAGLASEQCCHQAGHRWATEEANWSTIDTNGRGQEAIGRSGQNNWKRTQIVRWTTVSSLLILKWILFDYRTSNMNSWFNISIPSCLVYCYCPPEKSSSPSEKNWKTRKRNWSNSIGNCKSESSKWTNWRSRCKRPAVPQQRPVNSIRNWPRHSGSWRRKFIFIVFLTLMLNMKLTVLLFAHQQSAKAIRAG